MNEQTTKLIESLAIKLGTTADYLWAVLIRQALISGITDLVYYVIVIICGVILYRAHIKFCDDDREWSYYRKEESIVIPMGIIVVLWMVVALVCFFSVGNTFTALINPEYYALDKILSALK